MAAHFQAAVGDCEAEVDQFRAQKTALALIRAPASDQAPEQDSMVT